MNICADWRVMTCWGSSDGSWLAMVLWWPGSDGDQQRRSRRSILDDWRWPHRPRWLGVDERRRGVDGSGGGDLRVQGKVLRVWGVAKMGIFRRSVPFVVPTVEMEWKNTGVCGKIDELWSRSSMAMWRRLMALHGERGSRGRNVAAAECCCIRAACRLWWPRIEALTYRVGENREREQRCGLLGLLGLAGLGQRGSRQWRNGAAGGRGR